MLAGFRRVVSVGSLCLWVAACGSDDASQCETDDCAGTAGSSGGTTSSTSEATTSDPSTTMTTASTTGDPTDPTSMSGTDSTTAGAADWWNCQWARRASLAIIGPPGDEPLEDFAVPVFLQSSWLSVQDAAADGADLRFIDADGNALPYEVESWDPSGISVVWVGGLTIVAQGQGVPVHLYYANAMAEDEQAPEAVWAAYDRVWHLDGSRTDSASGASLDGTAGDAEGIAGPGAAFDAMDAALVEMPAAVGPDLFASGATLSAWLNPSGWGEGDFGRVLETASGLQGAAGWSWFLSQTESGMRFARGHEMAPGYWAYPNSIMLERWTHVAVSYDDSDSATPAVFHADAVEYMPMMISAPGGAVDNGATEALTLGRVSYDAQERNFTGVLDEIRIRSTVSSPRWIAAEVASVEGSMVASLGDEAAPAECG